jgi:hypothetical protein
MILYKAVILGVGSMFLMNCHAQKKDNTIKMGNSKTGVTRTTAANGEILYFKEGENRFLKEYQMNVTFKGISEDSRCPKNVNCIWAGVAVAQVEIMGTATRPMTLQIATLDNQARNYHSSASFNGYTVSLAEVQPYPDGIDGAKALKGQYVIGITIKKGETPSSTTK